MKLLFVYYVPSGGVETLNRYRSIALQKRNITPHFLYYEKRRKIMNDHYAPTFITKDNHEIKKLLSEHDYSAIVIISDFSALQRFRDLGYQGKMIIEVQGYGPKHVAKKVFTEAAPLVEKHAAGLLNPRTPHIEQLFQEIFPYTPMFSFNNCFDATQFTYKKPAEQPTAPILAWIGRIEDNKNWREFLQIGHKLIYEFNSNIRLRMYDDPTLSNPEEVKQLNMMIKKLKLEHHLARYGNLPNEQMIKHFSQIGDSGGMLCSTSKVEGAPYAILEALSCKCPVLTTDSDGVRSSIIHLQTGVYYPLGNIETACKLAKMIMVNKEFRETLRINGWQHVRSHFSLEQYGQNFINMLHSLQITT